MHQVLPPKEWEARKEVYAGRYPIKDVPSVEAVAHFVNCNKNMHRHIALPATFSIYWNEIIDKDVRTQCRKALRKGYVVSPTTTPHHEEIGELWESWELTDTKQGSPIHEHTWHWRPFEPYGWVNLIYGWPFVCYDKTVGYLDFVEVLHPDVDDVAAYMEIAGYNDDYLVTSTQSHKEHIHSGVVKLLFVSIVRGLIERGAKRLFYSKPTLDQKWPASTIFAKDLGFKDHELSSCS